HPLLDGREVLLAIQKPLIDAPGQSEAEKSSSAGLRVRELIRIIEVRTPHTIRSLPLDQLTSLPHEDVDIPRSAVVVFRKVFQHPCNSCKRPTIAPSPQHLLSISRYAAQCN